MFTFQMRVKLQDTDATGVLYFAEQFRMAQEVFEEFLKEKGFSLKQVLSSEYLLPIVHAAGDYMAPVRVGDELEISLNVVKMGTSSVTVHYEFCERESKNSVGRVELVHVVVDREKRTSVPIPDFLREIFALGVVAKQPSSV